MASIAPVEKKSHSGGVGKEDKFVLVKEPLEERKSLVSASKMAKKGVFRSGVLLRRKRGKKSAVPKLPPQLSCDSLCHQTLRYVVLSGIGSSVTITNIQCLMACGCTGRVLNTSVTTLFTSMRIHRLTIWPAVSASAASPEIVWANPVGDLERDTSKINSVPKGATVSTVVSQRPPATSQASQWFTYDGSNSFPVFQLRNLNEGAIIDFDVTCSLANNLTAFSYTPLATAALGVLYWMYLDSGTSKIQTLGRPTTI
jgi:hypothetical protein